MLEPAQTLGQVTAGLAGAKEDVVAVIDLLTGLLGQTGQDGIRMVGDDGRSVLREDSPAVDALGDALLFQTGEVFSDGDDTHLVVIGQIIDQNLFVGKQKLPYFI